MSPSSIFQICNTIAMLGWIVLIAMPFWLRSDHFIIGIIVTLFCIVYAWLIFSNFHFDDFRKFNTVEGVMQLFTQRQVVVAGWIHYLAFDLMTGLFIRHNALKHGISHWLLIPCFFFTFMLGPIGLLLYLLIRFMVTKQYFADNY
jgi:hypothetical protein